MDALARTRVAMRGSTNLAIGDEPFGGFANSTNLHPPTATTKDTFQMASNIKPTAQMTTPATPADPIVPANDNAYAYLSEGAELADQALDQRGYRRIQHMNESYTYHKDTIIAGGGYAIKNEDGSAPDIGKTETIKHEGGKSTVMACATQIDIALIGFSPRYFITETDDPVEAGKRNFNIVQHYINPADLPGLKAKCRSAISYFVVLKADDKRELFELTFKGFCTGGGAKCITEAKAFASMAAIAIGAKLNRPVKLHPFGLWLPLGVGDSEMVGTTQKSPVTPPAWKITAGEDLTKRMVSKDDYLKFIELRKQLDEYLATGRFTPDTKIAQLSSGSVLLPHAAAITEYVGQDLRATA